MASFEEKEQELGRLLKSRMVREGTHQYNLLSYLGKRSLVQPAEPLKEYTIGMEALGKPPDYDPRIDPTVRVEVGRLRRKLREHYQDSEDRSVKLVIPRGSYLPVFVSDSLPKPVEIRDRPFFWLSWAAAAVLVLILALTTAFFVFRGTGKPALDPEIARFWAPHLETSEPTLIVYGTPLFVKIEGSFFRDPRLNRSDELGQNRDLQSVLEALKPQHVRPLYNFTGVGEAEALFLLTRTLSSQGVSLSVQRSDTVSWEDLKDKHVIFLGGRKFNPQLPDLPVKPKYESISRGVINLRPEKGERLEYRTVRDSPHGKIREDYALISVYPGLNPHTRIVALECSSTRGTLAAAEFVTRPDTLYDFHSKGGPPAEKAAARAFQIVVGARFNDGIVVKLFYVAHGFLK